MTTPDEFAGFTREMLITQILQLRDLVTMEQASLASAREEIAKLERDVEFLSSNLAAEKSRVKVAESALGEANSHSAFVYRERAKALDDLATERDAREREKAHFYEQWTLEEARFLEMLHRAERAEATVIDLEKAIVDWETEPQYRVTNLNRLHRVAKDIMARAKEGEKR